MKRRLITAVSFTIAVLISSTTYPCTVFTASKDGTVLFGSNEDFIDPDAHIWFIPGDDATYGRVYWGFDAGFPQGGMNDQGLAWDCAATPSYFFEHDPPRPDYEGNLAETMLEECATVEEAIALFEQWDLRHMFRFQMLVADRTGDAAIIEGDTIIRKSGDHQVMTNFRQSLADSIPASAERFLTADSMLQSAETISAPQFESILDATHQEAGEGSGSTTQYSVICNLVTGGIHVYNFHNFRDAAVIELEQELKRGAHTVAIRSLAPEVTESYHDYFDEHFRISPTAISMNGIDPADYTGTYEIVPAARFAVTAEAGILYARMNGFAAYELHPEAVDTFFWRELDTRFRFVRNEAGSVVALMFRMYDDEEVRANRTTETNRNK